MVYACLVWSSLISRSNYKTLQVQQNKFLRIIGNYPRYTKITKIHDELGIETVHEYIMNLSKKYYAKIKNHNNPLVKNIVYNKNSKYIHKRIMDSIS